MDLRSFWQTYPKGAIVGSLVEATTDRFIVQVKAVVDGQDKLTALGMGDSVTGAEEIAQGRLLEGLGLGVLPAQSPVVAPDPVVLSPMVPEPTPVVPVDTRSPEPLAPELPFTLTPPPVEMVTELPPPAPVESLVTTWGMTEPTPPPMAVPETTAAAIAFKDLIAQTDQELQRLGWTAEQGKTFLLNTYGKKSRQLLADEELWDFLRHLQGLPTPLVEVAASSGDRPTTDQEPLDFSEIISRTSIELERLGWSADQGRSFLVQNYGKKSRQLLSDEELLHFLRHLESQPSSVT